MKNCSLAFLLAFVFVAIAASDTFAQIGGGNAAPPSITGEVTRATCSATQVANDEGGQVHVIKGEMDSWIRITSSSRKVVRTMTLQKLVGIPDINESWNNVAGSDATKMFVANSVGPHDLNDSSDRADYIADKHPFLYPVGSLDPGEYRIVCAIHVDDNGLIQIGLSKESNSITIN